MSSRILAGVGRLLAAIDHLIEPQPAPALDLYDETGTPRCCCRSAARIGTCESCRAHDHLRCPERTRRETA